MADILNVEHLTVGFPVTEGRVAIVDDVSFSVAAGETVCVVGESGSGKSMLALSLMRLLPPPGRIESGRILLDGVDLATLGKEAIRRLRGPKLAMIFQEPMTSLNPVFTVEDQITEALSAHGLGGDRASRRRRAIELLEQVEIPNAANRLGAYPHELSGGQRQRVMIAIALACNPRLLIADEPTTALDVTVQDQILELLSTLQKERAMGMIFITHDLGVVSDIADRVAVMYAGRLVETAPAAEFFSSPQHPYSLGLLGSVPRVDIVQDRLLTINGIVPSPLDYPKGCRFKDRCVFAAPRCAESYPPMFEFGGSHRAACFRAPVEQLA